MSNLYIEKFFFPTEKDEENAYKAAGHRMNCFNNIYPFGLFKSKEMNFEFEPVTILYGGNGSGKTTILNLLAEKLRIKRHVRYNKSSFFDSFAHACRCEMTCDIDNKKIITSDDVFGDIFNTREKNEMIDKQREKVLEQYNYYSSPFTSTQEEMGNVNYLDNLDKLHSILDAKSKSVTKSQYTYERTQRNIIGKSNGETAIDYFTNEMKLEGLYLLDEPENSLSARYQMDLASFLFDSSRFFGAQLIIATHSPFMLAIPNAKIYNLDVRPIGVTYDWTELDNMKVYYDLFNGHRMKFERAF